MKDFREWFDVVFKIVIAAAIGYGGFYLTRDKQTFDKQHEQQAQQNEDVGDQPGDGGFRASHNRRCASECLRQEDSARSGCGCQHVCKH